MFFFFFAVLFCVYGDDLNSKQKAEEKLQVKILPFPGSVQSGSEQPGPGATLLGWLNLYITLPMKA